MLSEKVGNFAADISDVEGSLEDLVVRVGRGASRRVVALTDERVREDVVVRARVRRGQRREVGGVVHEADPPAPPARAARRYELPTKSLSGSELVLKCHFSQSQHSIHIFSYFQIGFDLGD